MPTIRSTILRTLFAAGASVLALTETEAAETLDSTPRTAVISAFQPEWSALRAALQDSHQCIIGRTVFLTGNIEGKPVLLFLSGISMVNAAMASQLALDRF